MVCGIEVLGSDDGSPSDFELMLNTVLSIVLEVSGAEDTYKKYCEIMTARVDCI
jgi:hypothetical protein